MSGPPRRIKESKKKIKSTDKNPEKENELPSNLVFKVMQKVVIQIGREREILERECLILVVDQLHSLFDPRVVNSFTYSPDVIHPV